MNKRIVAIGFFVILLSTGVASATETAAKIAKINDNKSPENYLDNFPVIVKIKINKIKVYSNPDPWPGDFGKADFKIFVKVPSAMDDEKTHSHKFSDNDNEVGPWETEFTVDAWKVGREGIHIYVKVVDVDPDKDDVLFDGSVTYPLLLTSLSWDVGGKKDGFYLNTSIKDNAPSDVKGYITKPTDNEFKVNQKIEFSAQGYGGVPYPPDKKNDYRYRWMFGDGGSYTGKNPTYCYSSEGNYIVLLYVTDYIGQGAFLFPSDSLTLHIKKKKESQQPFRLAEKTVDNGFHKTFVSGFHKPIATYMKNKSNNLLLSSIKEGLKGRRVTLS